MRITEIKILPVDGDEKLKAYVTIKLDDCFVVRDMKVIKGNTGYFVAMPAKKMKDGTYRDLVHPLDKPTRQKLNTSAFVVGFWTKRQYFWPRKIPYFFLIARN